MEGLVLVIIFTILFLLWLLKATSKPPKFPPGPPRLPLIGSLPYVADIGPNSKTDSLLPGIQKLEETYGPVCGFYLGTDRAVLVSDFDLLKDMFKRPEFSARPMNEPQNRARPGWDIPGLHGRPPGIVFPHGKHWQEQRRFTMRTLKELGALPGKSCEAGLDAMINHEVVKLCKIINAQQKPKKPLQGISRLLSISSVNTLWTILAGQSLDFEDPKMQKINEYINHLTSDAFPPSPLMMLLPFAGMNEWPGIGDLTGFKKYKETANKIVDIVQEPVLEHVDNRKNGSSKKSSDFIDLYLDEMDKNADPESAFDKDKFGLVGLVSVLLDLFVAGIETSAASLNWTFLYLLHHPDIQDKLYKEISEVIGREGSASSSDIDRMPFTNAVLTESLRVTSFVYMSIPHMATADVTICGGKYVIPANTMVIPNLYHIMHQPQYFEDPDTFNPYRFLQSDNKGQVTLKHKSVSNIDRVIPFSVGKRFCPGQRLARKELFLFLVGIMQKFELKTPENMRQEGYKISDSVYGGLLRSPPNVPLEFRPRNATIG